MLRLCNSLPSLPSQLLHSFLTQTSSDRDGPLVQQAALLCCFGNTDDQCSQGASSGVQAVGSGTQTIITCTATQHPAAEVAVSFSADAGQTWLSLSGTPFTYTCAVDQYLKQSSCTECPTGAECNGQAHVYAQLGFWQVLPQGFSTCLAHKSACVLPSIARLCEIVICWLWFL